jgi:hypothetical protein
VWSWNIIRIALTRKKRTCQLPQTALRTADFNEYEIRNNADLTKAEHYLNVSFALERELRDSSKQEFLMILANLQSCVIKIMHIK